jgi:hypothetical protein
MGDVEPLDSVAAYVRSRSRAVVVVLRRAYVHEGKRKARKEVIIFIRRLAGPVPAADHSVLIWSIFDQSSTFLDPPSKQVPRVGAV